MTARTFTIVGAIDESDQARLVLERVGGEAAWHDAVEVHILRVLDVRPKYADRVPIADERDALLEEVGDVLDPFIPAGASWRTHVHVRVGRPDEEILALAHEARADLIAIGHHGDGRRRPFAGNTASRVLRDAPCTVLVAQDRLYDEAPTDQCDDCVRVRADSGGETWFCAAHHADDRPLHHVLPTGPSAQGSVGFGSGGVF